MLRVRTVLLSTVLASVASSLQVPRRVVISGGLAAALSSTPLPSTAKNTELYVTETFDPDWNNPLATMAQINADIYEPIEKAYAGKDLATAQATYLPSATLVDGLGKGRPVFVKGSNVASHLESVLTSGPSNMNYVLEREFQVSPKVAHVTYTFESAGVKHQGLQKVVKTASGKWMIEEDVFPFDSPKVYAMIAPQRTLAGVFMSLDPKLKLK